MQLKLLGLLTQEALDAAGTWYIRFINMTKSDDPEIDYRSKWATITFEIR